jgi:hypothetical protein
MEPEVIGPLDKITFGFEFMGKPAGTVFHVIEYVNNYGIKAWRLDVDLPVVEHDVRIEQ